MFTSLQLIALCVPVQRVQEWKTDLWLDGESAMFDCTAHREFLHYRLSGPISPMSVKLTDG